MPGSMCWQQLASFAWQVWLEGRKWEAALCSQDSTGAGYAYSHDPVTEGDVGLLKW